MCTWLSETTLHSSSSIRKVTRKKKRNFFNLANLANYAKNVAKFSKKCSEIKKKELIMFGSNQTELQGSKLSMSIPCSSEYILLSKLFQP